MNDTPIQIRNPEVVRAIRALARQTGRPITATVAQAVDAELRRRQVVEDSAYRRRRRAIREAAEAFRNLPVIGPLLTDDDLYDEDGMPR